MSVNIIVIIIMMLMMMRDLNFPLIMIMTAISSIILKKTNMALDSVMQKSLYMVTVDGNNTFADHIIDIYQNWKIEVT